MKQIIELFVLGSLKSMPAHAYQLKKVLEACIGHIYRVSDGMLYPLLKSLEMDGLIEGSNVKGHGHPDRVVYVLTETGEARFTELIQAPLEVKTPADVLDFYLRLALLDYGTPTVKTRLINERIVVVKEQLRCLHSVHAAAVSNTLDKEEIASGHGRLRELAAVKMEAELKWLNNFK